MAILDRVANAVRERDVYIEQPCRSYEHCLVVRRNTSLPFILDENITGIDALLRGHHDGAMDVINLKISKVGGLTKARQIRDLCVTLNIPMTIEDSWGGDIITAAIAHLAHSTPESLRFSATDFNSYVTVRNATGAPERVSRTWLCWARRLRCTQVRKTEPERQSGHAHGQSTLAMAPAPATVSGQACRRCNQGCARDRAEMLPIPDMRYQRPLPGRMCSAGSSIGNRSRIFLSTAGSMYSG